VAPRGFEFPKEKPEGKAEKLDFADAVQSLPVGPLTSIKDGFLDEQLRGLKVLCVVEGSRRFTPPGEFGLMPYEGCHILRFDAKDDATLKKVMETCQEKANEKIEVAGVKVAVFNEQVERDAWSYSVCRPRAGVLICATNKGYLEETLKRIEAKPKSRALPADLPEWKQVDTKAPVWAIRHYRKDFALEDPTSPLCPGGTDPNAVGMTFWVGDSGKYAEVRYLSDANDALKIATGEWEVLGLKPKCKVGAPGVVEIAVSLAGHEAGAMYFFVLMARLGHCIVA
jgi:hypothetical protein